MKNDDLKKKVHWKDLTHLSLKETIIENTISLPWLFASWTAAYYGYYLLALPFSFIFFLTALRLVHNGFHRSLGIDKNFTWLSLYVHSILMMVSVHAVQFNHLRHHKYCLGEDDYEGKCAKKSWFGAILYGPQHIYSIHKITLQRGNKKYRNDVRIELLSILIYSLVIYFLNINFLIYHSIVMIAGELFTAFFAVWTVHHDCDEETIARTQRTGWKNFITYNMFYHLEHHLFPAVPTIKLPELAKRIDETMPGLTKKQTF